ncbi:MULTISPECIES: SLC13 family permease [Mycobacteriaceae]|uniref:SLC13 family permease n=1 Tax=Mycolicibacterium parafortuitum TaxID=39692 RepID=A0ACC6MEC1_MYCPF|nr:MULTISPECIES: SLC13 family permease [Mycobacteriaceae]MDZ5085243.1 SLC13 family permease [Mycolicibacterium parafortuitum]GFM17540.1 citrate transporter [Mycobacterium sp. PO1]GFM21885.1 citrate transporter [Mycobacterium sp. PO2]
MTILAAVIVVVTLIVMTTGRQPAVLALICALVVAGLAGIATPAELFAGLSNGGVITIAAMLVIAKGVLYTGVITRVTYRLLNGVTTATQTLARLVPPVGVASALINTTPIVAMLIPAAKELERQSGVPARGVLLPIAHATTLAGSATLIGTSSNLLIAGIADPAGVELTMFSFVPIAVPVALVGWAVLFLLAPRMLRGATEHKERKLEWRAEIPVARGSNAVGRTAASLGVATTPDFELLEIQRWGEAVDADEPMQADDVLIYRATESGVRTLWASPRFGQAPQDLYMVSISTDEQKSVRDLEVDDNIEVIAAQTTKLLRDAPARPGEMCLVTARSVEKLADNPLVGLWQKVAGKAPQTRKTWIALLILLAVVTSAALNLAPIELIAVTGATLMVVTGVLTPRSAVRALNWNILAIIAGSVGLGVIVVNSGLGDIISSAILSLSTGSAALVVLVIAVGTTILTNVVSNAAAAAILTPVALTVADTTGLDPILLLTLIGTCISFTFINPFSHQSNLMVMKPGGYSTATFVRFGVPLILVCVVTAFLVGWGLLSLR